MKKVEDQGRIINEFDEEDRKEAAKKVLPARKREYLSKYCDYLDAADMGEVPDGNVKDLETAEKRYRDAKKKAGLENVPDREIKSNEALEEAFKLISSIVEASPFATKRRIADQFKDKMDDKLSKAYSNVKKTLQKMNDVDKEVREKGGETVAFTGDKITDFSKDPEVKKKQEEFNKATDDMHKASAKCDKVHHLRNLVRHYQTPEMAD